jgi:hypothetical protein
LYLMKFQQTAWILLKFSSSIVQILILIIRISPTPTRRKYNERKAIGRQDNPEAHGG